MQDLLLSHLPYPARVDDAARLSSSWRSTIPNVEHRRNERRSTGNQTGIQLQTQSHLSTFTAARAPPVDWSLLACQASPTAAALLICRCFKHPLQSSQ